ncbi:3'(2'),5'-bisphosphate nucleotidase [Vespertiliibacter pulmonis]|uniref:3'(2'),5'-bisphosphate nucleotidase CysQ n=1 Tax=Vespertiliibacter pulmonis TaxID=1443036 RepID=A0A3N4VTL8_9PAST|nr:3'(2'),5'-bisphosphate nucleotidase CysQ [Vespertiliibacter pulmonis]QLB20391.1 3'(2'),5'-bisphosphate nucleotidase [Vespertiliibacter pulmonis]RPE86378.1 3'(2'),5'-bisphosphate nucleotidase [Vespertiliibacter pulmonis]
MQQLSPQLLDDVLKIAYQAGEHLTAFYAKNVEIHIKADNTPLTEADLFVSQFITEQLTQLTPHIPVLSEESCHIPFEERKKWQEYWIIDPLDGTQQFINRTDQFSVIIALVQQNCPVLGVIHAPILHKTYYAMQANGAFLSQNGKSISLQPPMQNLSETHRLKITIGSSNNQRISDSLQSPYQSEFLKYGSSSLKAGLVAEGKADCYVRLGDTGEWDTAAADILLRECGGSIFDTQFQPLSYNKRETLVNPHFVMVGNKAEPWHSIFQFD